MAYRIEAVSMTLSALQGHAFRTVVQQLTRIQLT